MTEKGTKMEKLIKLSDVEKRESGLLADEVWRNDIYIVAVTRDPARKWEGRTVVQISIHRHDRGPVTNWPEKQAIKNQVVGEECEGIELYPAESRLHDQANRYHLWVIDDPTYQFPFGWGGRAVFDHGETGELVEE